MTFKLRQGVSFRDGRVNADAVVFT